MSRCRASAARQAKRRLPSLRALGLMLLVACGASWASACRQRSPGLAGGCLEEQDQRQRTERFLRTNMTRYSAVIVRAKRWIDDLPVDPVALQAAGLKGKKLFVELLDAYTSLHAVASPAQKTALQPRLAALSALSQLPEYHDMERVDDRTFKQGSTSYLRAAYLLERLGQDTGAYREQIRQLKPRLDAHLTSRGVNQQMAFSRYYAHFGLAEPFALQAAYSRGVIASRRDPYSFSTLQVYALTHEIFAPYDFGATAETELFSAEDRRYLQRTLDRLTVRFIMEHDPDLVSELVSCQEMLGLHHNPVYREALNYLLRSQRSDGSWGDYERHRPRLGKLVKQRFYLHTTSVTISALTAAFGGDGERDGR